MVRWRSLYIGSISTLGGVYASSSYAAVGVGVCDFEFFLDVDAGVFRLLVSFTLVCAVFLRGLLCLTSTLVCAVS